MQVDSEALTRDSIVDLLGRLGLPAQYNISPDPDLTDDEIIFSSTFSMSFGGNQAVVLIETEDATFLTWFADSIHSLELKLRVAAHYMYAVQGNGAFKNLLL